MRRRRPRFKGAPGRAARRAAAALAIGLAAASMGAGCKCGGDKPYVPYTIGAVDAAVAVDADAAPPPAPSSLDAGLVPFTVAPPGATTATVAGQSLAAPPGQSIVGTASGDFDGDGAADAVLVLRAEGAPAGSTMLAVAVAKNVGRTPTLRTVASSPLAKCPGDALPVRVDRRGKSSVTLEIGASCENRAPSRWILALAFEGKEPRARFSVGVADPPGAQPLATEIDTSDRDGDGLDDVSLTVALDGAVAPFEPGPRTAARLVWLDRSAGLSRDPEEPEASFKVAAAPLWRRASKAKEAPLVPVAVRQLRHLAHAVCAEGGGARLVQMAGASLAPCVGSRALEEAGLAKARASLTGGDLARAALAFDRAQRPPAAKGAAHGKELAALLEKSARDAATVRTLGAVPDEPPRDVPAFGPLAFEGESTLFVKTKAGVVRADVATGEEVGTDRPPWPSALGGDGHPIMVAAVHACDGVAVRAVFRPSDKGDGAATETLLPVVPPLGERCLVPRGEPQAVLPLAWGPSGLEVVVAGELLLVASTASGAMGRASLLASPLDAPGVSGSAKSLDGKAFVVPTSMGLVARGPQGTHLLRAKELGADLRDLHHCVITNDGRRVACVRKGRVVVGTWDR